MAPSLIVRLPGVFFDFNLDIFDEKLLPILDSISTPMLASAAPKVNTRKGICRAGTRLREGTTCCSLAWYILSFYARAGPTLGAKSVESPITPIFGGKLCSTRS
ncbi:hypothetical protein BJV74DRAFT_858219 [Russula compacta]|nr:hypothetical protein BJV74DRAFT_858219 [Russula compacta]